MHEVDSISKHMT